MKYPKNESVAKYVDYATDKKINETMSEAVKQSARKIAAYLDFIAGYWPDYEKHVNETTVTETDLRNLNPAEWDKHPQEVRNKIIKQAAAEKKQRLRTINRKQCRSLARKPPPQWKKYKTI
jgi:phage/plasmid primase-like uncharacterized protein